MNTANEYERGYERFRNVFLSELVDPLGMCRLRQSTIANHVGLSERQARRHLERMIEEGLLRKVRLGRRNVYKYE